ncbi:hypothetical protein AKJ51_00565 [candidate division MSBL1 archaeon SCGC-AAA382A20]|uniref:DUF7343 domain-containing protein n=1 Tax=candidate division MSBL1 archaeon SCGC-AAA382A20 TaxID=1698280 RepID=A0A133VMN7_9EURY|nr:hypothetical protein AKJ51_00565 [candidate division MSBL1 archaeon SCGC-AAA382A20]
MEFSEFRDLIILIAVIQGGFGLLLYGLIGGTAGVNFYSIGVSVLLLVVVSSGIGIVLYWLVRRYGKKRSIKTTMMALSEDEQKVLRKVIELEEVKQSELRRELDFSKSKTSALLNNLEDKNTIKKSRFKRTNIVEPTEQFQGAPLEYS